MEVEHAVFALECWALGWQSDQDRAADPRVRYTAEFQVVKMYHFPFPGIVDCLDTIGQIANPSHHKVRTLL